MVSAVKAAFIYSQTFYPRCVHVLPLLIQFNEARIIFFIFYMFIPGIIFRKILIGN